MAVSIAGILGLVCVIPCLVHARPVAPPGWEHLKWLPDHLDHHPDHLGGQVVSFHDGYGCNSTTSLGEFCIWRHKLELIIIFPGFFFKNPVSGSDNGHF